MGDGEEPQTLYEAIGRAIKVERTARGIERKELAERAGISYPYLSEIENGSKRPSSKALIAIAEALGLQPSDLLHMAESWPSEQLSAAEPSFYRRLTTPRRSEEPPPWLTGGVAASRPAPARTGPREQRARAELLAEIGPMLEQLSPDDLETVRDLIARLSR